MGSRRRRHEIVKLLILNITAILLIGDSCPICKTSPPHKPVHHKTPPHHLKPPSTPKHAPPLLNPPPFTPKHPPPYLKPPPFKPKPTPPPFMLPPPSGGKPPYTTPPSPPPPSVVKPTPPFLPPHIKPSPPICPPPPPVAQQGSCPIDTLKLNACVDVLGGLVQIGIGQSAKEQCCPVLEGLVGLDAAVCLCTTIKAKLLNINIVIPIAIQLLIDCGKTPPPGFQCPAS